MIYQVQIVSIDVKFQKLERKVDKESQMREKQRQKELKLAEAYAAEEERLKREELEQKEKEAKMTPEELEYYRQYGTFRVSLTELQGGSDFGAIEKGDRVFYKASGRLLSGGEVIN